MDMQIQDSHEMAYSEDQPLPMFDKVNWFCFSKFIPYKIYALGKSINILMLIDSNLAATYWPESLIDQRLHLRFFCPPHSDFQPLIWAGNARFLPICYFHPY